MAKAIHTLASVALLMCPVPAIAQGQVVPAAPVLMPSQDVSVLRAGTQITLRLNEELTTEGKRLRVGHRFNLEVAEDVLLNGHVVIPAGSPATGEVIEVRNKGMWGKSGRINARVLYVRVNGRQIRLTGTFDDKGVTGTAGVVASIALVPLAGFFVTGTSARIPPGSTIPAFIDEDVPVAVAAVAPEPLVIPAATAMPIPVESQAPAPAAPEQD